MWRKQGSLAAEWVCTEEQLYKLPATTLNVENSPFAGHVIAAIGDPVAEILEAVSIGQGRRLLRKS